MPGDLRSSGGGSTVRNSLGIREIDLPDGVYLRESRPVVSRPKAVLVQNALNFLSNRKTIQLAGVRFALSPKQQLRRLFARFSVRRADLVICLSHAMFSTVNPLIGRNAAAMAVVPVTVPLDVIDCVEHRSELPEGIDGIFHIGGILKYKRIDTLINAVATSALQTKSISLIGPATPHLLELMEHASSLRVALVTEEWSRADLLSKLGTNSTVVLTSSIESLSFPLAEAAALGCRVIASRIPAHVELAERLAPLEVDLFEVGDVGQLSRLLEVTEKRTPRPTLTDLSNWRNEWDGLRKRLLECQEA
jgi:glycosyltransferase involved in cell wall biosynthesis